MEQEKSNKGVITLLIVIIIILLCLVGYLLIGRDLLNKDSSGNTTTTANTDSSDTKNKMSAAEKYQVYLSNLEKQIRSSYNNNDKVYYKNLINGKNNFYDTFYEISINKNKELLFSSKELSLNNYKVSDGVLNMFVIEEGNAGYEYLFFVKKDGTINKFCISCITTEDKTPKIEKEDVKYVVSVMQGNFGKEVDESGWVSPIFIDIDGNIITK